MNHADAVPAYGLWGFLLQWPTLPTMVMFPVMVFMYLRLAIKEEAIAATEFGEAYQAWASVTPRFLPGFRAVFQLEASP